MAGPFVPVPLPVDSTGACISWTKSEPQTHTPLSMNCKPSPLYSVSRLRGVGPSGAAGVGAPTLPLLEGERSLGGIRMERPCVPTLLGYDILEERAKFTVYKILVTGGQGDSWVIFRRYTDFCRLNNKLKELFPSSGLSLPPKRWLKDNYDEEFLKERLIGLQTFLQSLMSHKDIVCSEAVRHFLCMVHPPGPFDSLEESRVFCESLEETNHRLQRELLENQKEVDALKEILVEKENHVNLLVKKVNFEGPCKVTA